MTTCAEKIISFCKEIEFKDSLPPGISVMNPFRNNPEVIEIITRFYYKFYNDNNPRRLILGINPGRFGAGVTGIPFTDTKRLLEKCGINMPGIKIFETSSVFIYEMIDRYGGPERFYSQFYINSVCPLGFTSVSKTGREINYNYYDSQKLLGAVKDFAFENILRQIEMGIMTDVCFCFGTGKNFKYISELNVRYSFFEKIIPLEHPRYIMQYKSKQKDLYIDKYLTEFQKVLSLY